MKKHINKSKMKERKKEAKGVPSEGGPGRPREAETDQGDFFQGRKKFVKELGIVYEIRNYGCGFWGLVWV